MACQQNGNQLPRDIPNKSGSWKTSWHRKPLQLKSLWERFVSTHWKVHTCIVFLMYFDDHFFTALLWNLRGTTFWLLMLTIINAQIRVIFISSELYDPWWQIEYITLRNLTFRFFFFFIDHFTDSDLAEVIYILIIAVFQILFSQNTESLPHSLLLDIFFTFISQKIKARRTTPWKYCSVFSFLRHPPLYCQPSDGTTWFLQNK